MKKEYQIKLENIRSYYETGAHKPDLTTEEMIEILIDNELSNIDEFHNKRGGRRNSGIYEEKMKDGVLDIFHVSEMRDSTEEDEKALKEARRKRYEPFAIINTKVVKKLWPKIKQEDDTDGQN